MDKVNAKKKGKMNKRSDRRRDARNWSRVKRAGEIAPKTWPFVNKIQDEP